MAFSLKRIKRPACGLLAMHPFVDVLEGRDLFTATAHDGMLDVCHFIDGPVSAHAQSPWSELEVVDAEEAADPDPTTALALRTASHQFELKASASDSTFCASVIDDSPWALFGNALHDRRGPHQSLPIPDEAELAAARQRDAGPAVFAGGRSLTGAMAPFLTMKITQGNHPFAR